MKKNDKSLVQDFWNDASCGENLLMQGNTLKEQFINQSAERYRLEPYIINFANFANSRNLKVLEIGVGLGADHQKFAEAGANLYGIDLTSRAVNFTTQRLQLFGLNSNIRQGDAEKLHFENNFFDKVYSWGVIHHSPDTPTAVKQIHRVLKKGGTAHIMIYHKYSIVGYMLWTRYALMKGKPWTSLKEIYSKYLESPGTKAYTNETAKTMFTDYSQVEIETVLTHGDLLESDAGQRHRGMLLDLAKKFFPRKIIKTLLPKHGLFMLIKATK